MQGSTLAKRLWALLFGATTAVYLWGLGRLPLVGPDEPRYAQVAREMLRRGDLFTPTLGGHAWFEKPVLLYWMMMASYTVFGATEFAARVGAAVSGLLTVVFVGWLAQRVERSAGGRMLWFGLASAGVAAASAGLLVFSRAASFDAPLTLTVTAALCCFFVFELDEEGRGGSLPLVGFWAGVGASLLAKGLVGPVLVFGVVGLYFVLRRRVPDLSRLGLLWGPLLALGVASLWYAPVIMRHGRVFVDAFIIQHHFARYVSNKYNHPQPFYFYLPVMALLALPWTAFVAAGAARAAATNWRAAETTSRLQTFALAWLAMPVLFFSLSGSKLPGYVLPALPGAALLAGASLARYVRGEGGTGLMRLTGALVLLGLGGIFYAVRAGFADVWCGALVGVPVVAAGGLALFAASKRKLCAAAVVLAALATVALIVGCGLKETARRESVRELIARADAEGYSNWPVYYLLTDERTAEFYAGGRLGYKPDGSDAVRFDGEWDVWQALMKQGDGGMLILVKNHFLHRIADYPPLETKVIADNGAVTIAAVRLRP